MCMNEGVCTCVCVCVHKYIHTVYLRMHVCMYVYTCECMRLACRMRIGSEQRVAWRLEQTDTSIAIPGLHNGFVILEFLGCIGQGHPILAHTNARHRSSGRPSATDFHPDVW